MGCASMAGERYGLLVYQETGSCGRRTLYLPAGLDQAPAFLFECFPAACFRRTTGTDWGWPGIMVFDYRMPADQLENWAAIERDIGALVDTFRRP